MRLMTVWVMIFNSSFLYAVDQVESREVLFSSHSGFLASTISPLSYYLLATSGVQGEH
jgi:hypothetical protein